ncbi:MAG: ParB/RepB/Spo0J family partition protein [Lachnospiraceae bacterium]|nr:ParB/RepB/Spo0J family partition protein [Lachnospiraceae bacterium]
MAVKKSGLGKGLDSLIPEKKTSGAKKTEVNKDSLEDAVYLDINKVEPNREQPRKKFDEDALEELADSIKEHGVLVPLLVKDRGDYYQIIAGERRWRAAKKAKLKQVPALVKDLTEQEIVEISLIENIQRENLNPIEEAVAYKKLLEEFHLKQDEVAERVSKSRAAVANSMRLLKLSEKVQQMLIDELITTGHARALIAVEDEEKQYAIAQKILDEKLSVRDTEKLIKKMSAEKKEKEKKEQYLDPQLDAVYKDMEEKMKDILGTKVIINKKTPETGKVEIEYYSQDELNRIIEMFQKIN